MTSMPAVWPVASHTDNVGPGSTFVAIKGQRFDGAQFVADAIKKGATKIVLEHDAYIRPDASALIEKKEVIVQRVPNARKALARLSAQAYDFPADKLHIIGITGTKGKTTTAYITYHILRFAGMRVALLSTVENKIDATCYSNPLTTAQPDYLHMFFDQCVKRGITHVVMEVAAQAFSLHRVEGVTFAAGAFTNFSHEHLEFYHSMDSYFAAKCKLFTHMKKDAPVFINSDDPALQALKDTYAWAAPLSKSMVTIHSVAPSINGQFKPNAKQDFALQVQQLMGAFNLYNLLFGISLAHSCGVSYAVAVQAVKNVPGVPGRLQQYRLARQVSCFIDYAHTPDSYNHVLQLLREQTDQLIVIFGCGGMRDKFKRPKMGVVAAQYADRIILTNDNPRNEDPLEIVQDIQKDLSCDARGKVQIILDRAVAIEHAYQQAEPGAIIAVLGKGPDAFQIIGDTRYDYSDAAVIESLQ